MPGIRIGPANRAGGVCVSPDVLHEFAAEIGGAGKHSTGNDISFDFAEPELSYYVDLHLLVDGRLSITEGHQTYDSMSENPVVRTGGDRRVTSLERTVCRVREQVCGRRHRHRCHRRSSS